MLSRCVLSRYLTGSRRICEVVIGRKEILQVKSPFLGTAVRNIMHRPNPSQKPCPPKESKAELLKYKGKTMNDLPCPEGCWQEAYDKAQEYYNKVLIAGCASLVASILLIYLMGHHVAYYNYAYPELPKEVN